MRVLVISRSRLCKDHHLWREANKQDFRVKVVSGDYHECPCPRHPNSGLPQTELLSTWHFGTSTSVWLRNLRKVVLDFEPHALHVDGEPWSLQVTCALRTGLPVVAHAAESIITSAPWLLKVRRAQLTKQFKELSGIAFWGKTTRAAYEELFDLGGLSNAIIPACPPSPEDFFATEGKTSNDNLVVGFVGRLTVEKGIFFLIEVLSHLQKLKYKVQLNVLSKDFVSSKLIKQCNANKIKIHLASAETPEKVRDFMADCDLIAVPSSKSNSWQEQWGRVAAEAQLVGVPVLLSNHGELPHMATPLARVLPLHVNLWAQEIESIAQRGNTKLTSSKTIESEFEVQAHCIATEKFSLARYVDKLWRLWEEVAVLTC